MALIGSIAISMQATTAGLAKGLATASSLVKSYNASAKADFGAGSKAIQAGLAKVGDAAHGIGLLAGDALKTAGKSDVAKLVKAWGGFIVSEGTAPIRESFGDVFAAAGKAVGPRLATAFAPIQGAVSSAVRATGKSLADVIGAPVSRAASGVGRSLAGIADKANLGPLAIQFGRLSAGAGTAAGGVGRFGLAIGKVGWGAASKGAASVVSSLASVGAAAAKAGAVGAVGLAALGIKAGASAAHLEEAYNKTDQVFGKYGENVIATANKMADAYGTERQAYLDGTAALGGQLQGVGYAEKDAAALSTQLANLAADAAAFRDVGFDDALLKIRSGLSGEAEPLKAWGMDISDAAVKTEGLRLGLVKAGREMDNSAKVQARMSLIQKGLAKDSGALARESTGTAAQMSEFWGRLSHLMETIGQTTAPILGSALQGINQAVVAVGLAWEDGSAAVMSWFGVTSEGVEGATGGVGIFGRAVEWLGTAWDVARGGVATFFGYFESAISKVSGWLATILDGLHKLGAGDWAAGARDALQGYSDAARSTSEGLAGYAAEAFGRDASQATDSYWARARAKIDAARQEMATAKQEEIGAPKAAEAAAKPAKGKASEFAEAMKLGSTAAASTLLRSRYGLGKDGAAEAAKATAANTKEVVPALKAIETAIKGKAAGPAVVSIG